MGRVISSSEHNIPGSVTVGRPLRPGLVLPPNLAELQLQRANEVEVIKELAKHGLSGQVQIETQ
ncbi:MAG: hypothetical protein WDN66_00695 [Candidatus Saccharibacteria bacterium]